MVFIMQQQLLQQWDLEILQFQTERKQSALLLSCYLAASFSLIILQKYQI